MPSRFRITIGLKKRHQEYIQKNLDANYSAMFQALIDRLIEEENT